MKVTDEWLYKCMPIVDASIIQEVERQVDKDYEFSNKFERKMKQLIRKETYPWLEKIQNIVKNVAIIFVGMIGIALVFTMSVEAYRTKFFETIRKYLNDIKAYELRYDNVKKTEGIEYTEPTYIPEGFEESKRIESAIDIFLTFQNEKRHMITWSQSLAVEGGVFAYDSEYDVEKEEIINGVNVTFNLYNEGYMLAYFETEYYVYCITAESIDVEEIIKMIESADF